MFSQIMVPVDLRHRDQMRKALDVAADLARQYSAPICYVGVTSPEPGELGHRPEEFATKLAEFGAAEGKRHGQDCTTQMVVAQDPTTEIDAKLSETVSEIGADLVVMATHMPNVTDYFWSSHGGALARHTRASVMLVRG
ncbi:MAG: universal stress protein [Paracoccaceae bacterium]